MLRKHIERIANFPVTTIILAIFATAFFAYQFKDLHMVLDPKALLPQDHPYVQLNNEIEKQFGGSRVVLIGVASKDGDIFNPSDIEKIRLINEEVKTIPGILTNNVVSIADRKVKFIKAEGDSLEIKGLLDEIEYTPEGMSELKKRIYSNPMFINSLISEDGTVAAIILDFKGGAGDWWQKQDTEAAARPMPGMGAPSLRRQLTASPQTLTPLHSPEQENKLQDLILSSAWAQEDWKKWQKKENVPDEKPEPTPDLPSSPSTEKGASRDEKSMSPGLTEGHESPSPPGGEGKGEGEAGEQQGDTKWPAEGQKGQWPAEGRKGQWPAGGEGGWPGQDGDKGWEQWYVSDSTIHGKVLEIVDKYKDANTEIYVGGLPIALSFLEADSWRMSRYIYPLALIIIMFILFFAFRSIQGMMLPIVCALLSVVWAVGLMGVFRMPLDPWNMMTPILILAVAAGHSVQILKRYYEELENVSSPQPSPFKEEGGVAPSMPSSFSPGAEGSGGRWGIDVSKQAVVESLTKIGPVMITAGIVAAASFASLITFKLKTFQSFGIFTAFGILSALILEMTFIPAARSLMRPPKKAAARSVRSIGDPGPPPDVQHGPYTKGNNFPSGVVDPRPDIANGPLDRLLLGISNLVTRRSWLVWISFVIVIAVSVYGIEKLTIINSLKGLFFESTQFRKDDAALNRYFGGTATFYIHIEGDEPDSLKDPAVLRAIASLQQEIEAVPEVGKAQSYVDYIKAFNQSMHGGDEEYRTIPDSRATISEYLFLFSLSGSQGEMNRFLDYQYQKSVIWVFLKDDSTVLGEKLISIVNKYTPSPQPSPPWAEGVQERAASQSVPSPPVGKSTASSPSPLGGEGRGEGELHERAAFPPGIKIGVAGSIPVMMALNETMVAGKIWNILQIGIIVFVISSIALRSPLGGILVLVPLAIAVLINFGVLGIAGIGLGVGTAAISAMSVGFGADYSIYLLYRLREEVRGQKENVATRPILHTGAPSLRPHQTMDAAIKRTLLTAGKAIIFVALALSAGGLTLLFTGFYLHMEGFLVPLAMTTSSLATLILLPAIVRLIKPGFISR